MGLAPAGITGFDDRKFWIALVLHIAAWPLFFQGALAWDAFHVVMPFIVSFVVLTTLAWDYRIMGNPNRLHNFILHALFLVSLIFLLNRLLAVGNLQPEIDSASGLGVVLGEAVRRVPPLDALFSLFDFVLRWLGFAVVLFFVSGAIIFPRRIALALLLIFSLVTIALSVGRDMGPSLWSLFAGLVMVAGAFALQRADDQATRFWNRVAATLSRAAPEARMDTEIKLALLDLMRVEGAVNERQVRGVVAAKLQRSIEDPLILPVCGRVAEGMANADGLAESRDGNRGWRFVLNMPPEPPDFFTVCARTVRILVVTGFCIIYILSPIDLIPDSIPVFGVVDDMIFGAAGLLSVVKTLYDTVKPHDRHWSADPFSHQ